MRTLRFYKDPDGAWYVDLPEWRGSKSELAMVAGADHMLEYMAEGDHQVHVTVSETHFEGADRLEFVRPATELQNGAYYHMPLYRGVDLGLEMWLCDVTLFVFGHFPPAIFVSAQQ